MILIGDAADEQGWKAERVTTKSAPPRRGVATLRRSIGLGSWLVFSNMASGKCASILGGQIRVRQISVYMDLAEVLLLLYAVPAAGIDNRCIYQLHSHRIRDGRAHQLLHESSLLRNIVRHEIY